MAGRWQEGAGSEQAATGSETGPNLPAGRRARLRRLWRSGAAAQPAAIPAATSGATATAAAGHGTASGAVGTHDGSAARPDSDAHVPRLLQVTAAWSWRLLLTGLVIYLAFRLAVYLRLVTLPFIAAMLVTALVEPFAVWLRRHGFSPLLATWCTFFLAFVVIAGAITLLANQVSNDYPTLFHELQKTANHLQHSLAGPPF